MNARISPCTQTFGPRLSIHYTESPRTPTENFNKCYLKSRFMQPFKETCTNIGGKNVEEIAQEIEMEGECGWHLANVCDCDTWKNPQYERELL